MLLSPLLKTFTALKFSPFRLRSPGGDWPAGPFGLMIAGLAAQSGENVNILNMRTWQCIYEKTDIEAVDSSDICSDFQILCSLDYAF